MTEPILRPPPERFFEDFIPGLRMPDVTLGPLMVGDQVRWAGASDNYHAEFHHDEHVARAAGLPGIILSGPLIGAWMLNVLTEWLGQHARMLTFYNENREPTMPRDVLHIHAHIAGSEVSGTVGVLAIECGARNQHGLETTPGRARASLPLASQRAGRSR
jgi:acyl dehydratase